jgi:hypothetical protein
MARDFSGEGFDLQAVSGSTPVHLRLLTSTSISLHRGDIILEGGDMAEITGREALLVNELGAADPS